MTLGAAVSEQLTGRPLTRALTYPAIEYVSHPTSEAVAELRRRIDAGDARLVYDEDTGYLRSVLDALNLPVESQMS